MTLIQQIASKALAFVRSRAGKNTKSSDFVELVQLVSKLTADELKYDARGILMFSHAKQHYYLDYAPCVYTEIYEDETMNMSIFGLREEGQIPLHDHPSMHGVLKVLYGKLSLTSYTKTNKIALPKDINVKNLFKQKLDKWQQQTIMATLVAKETILTPDDPPIVLDPDDQNFHRIAAVDGSAAFFDLLTPPYYPPHRDCHYYTVLEPADEKVPTTLDNQSLAWMAQIRAPRDYVCESYGYEGDPVDLDKEYSLQKS